MRILLIANTLPPTDVSGVGEQVLQLATGLEELGHTVRVMGRRGHGGGSGGGPDEPAPPPFLERRGARGPKGLFPLTAVPAALGVIRRFRPEVVQVHESDGALVALAVRLLAPFLGRPRLAALLQVSYREERRAVRPLVDGAGRVLGRPGAVEHRFRRFKAPLHIALGTLTARLAHLLLAPSRETARELERDYLPPRESSRGRVAVVPNVTGGLAIEPEAIAADILTPDALTPDAPENGLGDGAGHWLFVGRLRIRKGVEVLLEALARGTRSEDDLPLLVAGDGEHGPALRETAEGLGLLTSDRVRFLGRCSAGRVRALLVGARALVVPSTYEGMPLVILEAMEAGVPVIASRVSGIPEVVVDGETGWLVPAEAPEALAAALEEARRDPAEARRRGQAGRRRVGELYRPRRAAELWLEAASTRLARHEITPRDLAAPSKDG